jgi:hypothetical protein
MKKVIISESEKSKILQLHNSSHISNDDVVITDWLSPDEKYVVFLDELYDIPNKVKLGNIWEDFNTLKLFLEHCFNTSDLPKTIKEHASNVLNNQLLTESVQNLNELKQSVKLLVNEGFLSAFKNWVIKTGKSTVDGFVQFAKDTYKGATTLIDKVSKGEWKEVFKLLGKGVIYLLRKLRSALYHPIGLILDAILIATGIGLGVQKVVWALIVALDVYELLSGDHEEEMPIWKRLLFLGIDILGLAVAGAAAKAAKLAVEGTKGLSALAKTSVGKKTLTSMVEVADKVPGLLEKAAKFLSKKFPKGSKFIYKIINKVGNFIKSLKASFNEAIGRTVAKTGEERLKHGVKAGLGTSAVVAGLGTYHEYKQEKSDNELGNALKTSTVVSDYDINKL